MSIRLRFTLLYNAILAVTLAVFGVTLYSIQSQTTYDAIKRNILRGSDTVGTALLHQVTNPGESVPPPHGTRRAFRPRPAPRIVPAPVLPIWA